MLTPHRIALQLYTVRDETARDFVGTLKRVADIGYQAVELAGYGSLSVAELTSALADHGLQAVSAHVPLATLESTPEQAIADLQQLGCAYAVLPFLPVGSRGAQPVRDVVAVLNRVGAMTRQAGIVLAYHNHAFEYEPLTEGAGGQTILDFLIENTDPALVAFELDVFWSRVAGADPVAELRRLTGRVPLLHLKDYTGETTAQSAAPVGEGQLDWAEIIAAANDAGTEWGIVEQDFPADPLRDAATGLTNAKRLLAPIM